MPFHQRWLLAGLATAAALSLVGCAIGEGQGQKPDSASSEARDPGPLPIVTPDPNDPYNAYLSEDLLAISSAKFEVEYKCYGSNGYPQFLEVLPVEKANAFRGQALTPDFKSTFASFGEIPWFPSEAYARAAGFGHSMPARDPYVHVSDAAFTHVSTSCEEKALATISGSAELLRAYTVLGNKLAEAVETAASKSKGPLTQKVFDCMSKGRYKVEPNGPNKQDIWNVDFGVPYGSQKPQQWPDLTKGGAVQIVPGTPENRYWPTALESEAAAAMHQCSIESGARDSWNNAINEAKKKALAENEATLSELNPKIRELAKSAAIAVQSQP